MRCATPLLPFTDVVLLFVSLSCTYGLYPVKVEALSPGLLGKEKDDRKKAKTAFAANYCGGTL